jgi:hypothetical protein
MSGALGRHWAGPDEVRRSGRAARLTAGLVAGVAFLLVAGLCAGPASAGLTPTACPNQAVRVGASASLPDCRAFEQVSPVNKNAFNAVNWNVLEAPAQAASNGERVFYEGLASFPGAQGSNAGSSGHVSVRTPFGWHTVELTPGASAFGPTGEYFVSYPAFSGELTQGVVKVPLPLTAEANQHAWNLYVRELAGEAAWAHPSYSWINAAQLATPAEELCSGAPGDPSCVESIEFAGASTGFGHMLFESSTQLVKGAPLRGWEELYENANGAVRIVGVLPDGTVAKHGATGGSGTLAASHSGVPGLHNGDGRVEHAISADGERVVFEAQSDGGEPYEAGQSGLTEVYDRIGARKTIELSQPAAGAKPANGAAEPAEFWAASADGARVFFTSSAELTGQSNTGPANEGNDLYEARLEEQSSGGPPKVSLHDLTVDAADVAGARVLGVVGASEDGEYVYFVAEGRLIAGRGVDGRPNLYVERGGGRPTYVATLQAATPGNEEAEPGDAYDWTAHGQVLTAYVTPDGRHLAFSSHERLATASFPSGYDNENAVTGEADSEVYEYTAPSTPEEAAGEAGRLVCASCDPTGTRPTGNAFIAGTGFDHNTGLDGVVEEAHGGGGGIASTSTPFYHVPAVSDGGGRVFFTARPYAGELAAGRREETTAVKVYEYEQDGEGSCASEAGCVYRLSGTDNPTWDIFLGASAEGADVFFATFSQLAPTDEDNLIDVYDAREYGGFPAPEVPAECEQLCQGAPGAQASAPPLVSTLIGPPGNLSMTTTTVGKKPSVRAKVKQPSCTAKARRLKRVKRRRRALRRCAHTRSYASVAARKNPHATKVRRGR